MKRLLYITNKQYQEYCFEEELYVEDIHFFCNDSLVYYDVDGQQKRMDPQKKYRIHQKDFVFLSDESTFYYKESPTIYIGQNNSDIVIEKGQYVIQQQVILSLKGFVYLNGQRSFKKKISFSYGDQILLSGYILMIVGRQTIEVIAFKETYTCFLRQQTFHHIDINQYQRSPRIMKTLSHEHIQIEAPSPVILSSQNNLVKMIVPPLVSAIGTAIIAMVIGRGAYMLVGVVMTLVSLCFSVWSYVTDKKETQVKQCQRKEVYENYLLEKRKQIYELYCQEIAFWEFHYPTIIEISQLLENGYSRLYEKTKTDKDFLGIVLGRKNQKSEYSIDYHDEELSLEKDELHEEAKTVFELYQEIPLKPYCINLANTHLGLLGESLYVHGFLHRLLVQMTYFHSYHDVCFLLVDKLSDKEIFDYVKWYPHCGIPEFHLTGHLYQQAIQQEVLDRFCQILKERQIQLSEGKQKQWEIHYLLIVDDLQPIVSHPIQIFLPHAHELGVTLIFTAEQRNELPDYIKTILSIKGENEAVYDLEDGMEKNVMMQLDSTENMDFILQARRLRAVKHLKQMSQSLPQLVTFYEMYDVKEASEIPILDNWQKNRSYYSLSVPIGVRSLGEKVELNMHENAHGPHGLIAGMTGSGKSELLQTLILSLAVRFNPYEIGFLLIDYKGGGMAHLFEGLPHLLGTMTNLDGDESYRTMLAIQAELSRRQRLFQELHIQHIHQYHRLFETNKKLEPLPHLCVICDEFAELKKEQPDFMSELVSVARIGRTLGIHLILATQKPSGIVDDQIWSNARFKIALRVQDENDSREILKTDDAAYMSEVGRAYLQVGHNEIYELFQSAWSGCCRVEKETSVKQVYELNSLGQPVLLDSHLGNQDFMASSLTQLEEVIQEIQKASFYYPLTVKKTWLPPLPHFMVSPYLNEVIDVSKVNTLDLSCAIGYMDIPHQQLQQEYMLDIQEEGHVAIFGTRGYGKTMTMMTLLLTLAMKNNPYLLHMYILDLSHSSLVMFQNLPHMADYLSFDDEEKRNKFQQLILDEMKRRKQLFLKEMSQDFTNYNQTHPNQLLNAIIIGIEDYDGAKELGIEFEDFVMKVVREGVSLGIYLILTATRKNAMRFAMFNYFKYQIVHYMYDKSELMNLFGKMPYQFPEIKGRALIENHGLYQVQIYTPTIFKDNEEMMEKVQKIVKDIHDDYTGKKLKSIPVLPEVLTYAHIQDYPCFDQNQCALGLSLDKVEVVSTKFFYSPYLIIGPHCSGKTQVMQSIIEQVQGQIYVFDLKNQIEETHKVTRIEKNNISDLIDDLKQIVENKKKTSQDVYLFIHQIDEFIEIIDNPEKMSRLLRQAIENGVKVIACVSHNQLRGIDSLTRLFKESTCGLILGQLPMLNVYALETNERFKEGEGLFIENENRQKIKVLKSEGGKT